MQQGQGGLSRLQAGGVARLDAEAVQTLTESLAILLYGRAAAACFDLDIGDELRDPGRRQERRGDDAQDICRTLGRLAPEVFGWERLLT